MRERSSSSDVPHLARTARDGCPEDLPSAGGSRGPCDESRTRDAICESRARLAAIVECAEDAIVGAAVDGKVTYWSPAAERMYGYAAHEVLGRTAAMLCPPEKQDELVEIFLRVLRGEAVRNLDSVRVRKDGTRFEASLTFSPVRQDGVITGVSGIVRDMSGKKRLEAQLAVADRMASVGTIAAAVAHEINNPLGAMIANLDFLREEIRSLARGAGPSASATVASEIPALLEPLEEARDCALKVRDIVRDLRVFSRGDDERRHPVSVESALDSAARIAWNEVRHRARIEKDYGRVPQVLASSGRLGQVFLNLIANAAQAIPAGAADRNVIRLVTRLDPERRVVIEVRDTGAGIPPEILGRIFDPFFTTKPPGVGTGLGLSICQRIVADLGGTIAVESRLGAGTTFRVTIPAVGEDAPVQPEAAPAPEPASRRGRVLVVDDDALVGTSVRRTLQREHDVVLETDARAALARIVGGERYDVVLCDLVMPRMTGMQLHGELVRVAPDAAARMVFLTGGAFTGDTRAFLERVPNLRLDKPFDPLQLRAVVRERLR
jgi:PAS domain S-box-containing protein